MMDTAITEENVKLGRYMNQGCECYCSGFLVIGNWYQGGSDILITKEVFRDACKLLILCNRKSLAEDIRQGSLLLLYGMWLLLLGFSSQKS
jgi:hypothetical protein